MHGPGNWDGPSSLPPDDNTIYARPMSSGSITMGQLGLGRLTTYLSLLNCRFMGQRPD